MIPILVREIVLREIRKAHAKETAAKIISSFLRGFHVKCEFGSAHKILDNIGKQSKYATAVALTRTAKRLQAMAETEVDKVFDKPTRFVQRGFYTKSASVSNLEAVVGIKDRQAKVLRPHIVGGRRDAKRFEQRLATDNSNASGYWVPGEGIKLNAQGNLTKGQITQIAAGLKRTGKYADVFVGVPTGHRGAPFGIWARKVKGRGRKATAGIVPLLIRVDAPKYRTRFDFFGIAEKNAHRIFEEEFDKAFRRAMASAR